MSPFQEFFFRNWLHPRQQLTFGKPIGLVVSSLAFTFWHFFPPLESSSTTMLQISPPSYTNYFGSHTLFDYIYQHTRNIVAPWIAHALGEGVLALIGMMNFIQYTLRLQGLNSNRTYPSGIRASIRQNMPKRNLQNFAVHKFLAQQTKYAAPRSSKSINLTDLTDTIVADTIGVISVITMEMQTYFCDRLTPKGYVCP